MKTLYNKVIAGVFSYLLLLPGHRTAEWNVYCLSDNPVLEVLDGRSYESQGNKVGQGHH